MTVCYTVTVVKTPLIHKMLVSLSLVLMNSVQSLSQALNFLFSFPMQMTEGRLCQVQLLDDRKLELLVQVGILLTENSYNK